MKVGILVVVGWLISLTCACFAQDVIVTKDARKINAKVTEVNVDNIKYRNFDNLDGPTYTLLKSDIVTILYQNGQVETFETVSQEHKTTDQTIQVNTLNTKPSMRAGDPLLYRQYKSGKRTKFAGVTLAVLGAPSCVGGVFGMLHTYGRQKTNNFLLTIGGVCATAGGVYLYTVGHRKKNNALNQYYSLQPSAPHFQLNFNPNNVGLAYVF